MTTEIYTLNPATCNDAVQGTPKDIALIATGGKAPYTYQVILDGVVKASTGPIPDTSHTFMGVLFTESVGAHTLICKITDSCATLQTAFDQCTTFNILSVNICIWVSGNGGVAGITIPKIFNLIDAYIGIGNISFIPTDQQILGCVDYYLGFTASGNSKTGCSF